mmetsp:Transcript_23881/g.49305  ORF Transcript_23881/g.49305 Transcript_23881/m.49305 type:complete len:506 (-) Transcript_23881:247-1764(-)|eukprot:CAMPEP_0178703458 /NCGR_PEP_ID=MMETSP0699-20121125/13553_1 /TAXON_ID=265572 /ORGANISM="Extubocellulus spinifer, Strain CCMP396" /LENGTH=505 /DNA_ID=CAMNT_0020350531 /DNA_START=60 /DNA_END=1577 /DNA_ORIENTATION=+
MATSGDDANPVGRTDNNVDVVDLTAPGLPPMPSDLAADVAALGVPIDPEFLGMFSGDYPPPRPSAAAATSTSTFTTTTTSALGHRCRRKQFPTIAALLEASNETLVMGMFEVVSHFEALKLSPKSTDHKRIWVAVADTMYCPSSGVCRGYDKPTSKDVHLTIKKRIVNLLNAFRDSVNKKQAVGIIVKSNIEQTAANLLDDYLQAERQARDTAAINRNTREATAQMQEELGERESSMNLRPGTGGPGGAPIVESTSTAAMVMILVLFVSVCLFCMCYDFSHLIHYCNAHTHILHLNTIQGRSNNIRRHATGNVTPTTSTGGTRTTAIARGGRNGAHRGASTARTGTALLGTSLSHALPQGTDAHSFSTAMAAFHPGGANAGGATSTASNQVAAAFGFTGGMPMYGGPFGPGPDARGTKRNIDFISDLNAARGAAKSLESSFSTAMNKLGTANEEQQNHSKLQMYYKTLSTMENSGNEVGAERMKAKIQELEIKMGLSDAGPPPGP